MERDILPVFPCRRRSHGARLLRGNNRGKSDASICVQCDERLPKPEDVSGRR